MSLPPLNLLLPHVYTFRDTFVEYPLLIHSQSSAAIATYLLTYHAAETPIEKSIFIHYGELSETLAHRPGNFFSKDGIRKGKFLQAASEVQIMHVNTLHELRALLFLMTTRSNDATNTKRPIDDQSNDVQQENMDRTSVADSEESNDAAPDVNLPLLAISGMDRVHFDAGELSMQGLSRTLSSALEAAGKNYHLVLHSSEELDGELALMNESTYLPDRLASATTTYRNFYKRFFACEWNDTARSRGAGNQATWRYLNGGGYKVQWEEDEIGQVVNSSIALLHENDA